MSRIRQLLRRPSPETIKHRREQPPDVVAIDDEDADQLFGALSSATARRLLAALHEQPRTASDLTDTVDSSIQNVSYHLGELREAGLVEVAETWYSEQGREMDVYAPTSEALVLFAGDELDRPSLFEVVRRLIGGLAVTGLAAVAVERFVRHDLPPSAVGLGAGRADGGSMVVTLSPGVTFFLGGLLALVVATLWWGYRSA